MAVDPIGLNMLWPVNCGVAGVLRCPSAGGVGGCVECIGCCPWNVGGYVALAPAAVAVLGGCGCTGPVPALAAAPSGAVA